MKRRSFLQSSSLAFTAVTIPSWAQAMNLNPYDMKLLRRNVGIFVERGGTIGWLMDPKGNVVIDTQWKEQSNSLIKEIQSKSTAPFPYLINTHHHGDHTSGNIAFKDLAQQIVAHENSLTNQMNVAKKNNNESDQHYPNLLYKDRWQQTVGDEIIDMQYWGPAHTNGDSIIHFQNANVVHCGDLVFNRKYPYIDKPAGAMIENWINVLQLLQSNFDNETMYIFGHAGEGYDVTGDKDDLAAMADYLTALLEFMSLQIKSGKTKEQIMECKAIPGAPEWKGEGVERSLEAAYVELTSN